MAYVGCLSRTCTGASTSVSRPAVRPFTAVRAPVRRLTAVRAVATTYKVELLHEGQTFTLEVPEGENILNVALDQGIKNLSYDCKMGVCMTCPAKMASGQVDQAGAMLSDDVTEKGYVLLCVAQPKANCKIATITEDELLDQQFGV